MQAISLGDVLFFKESSHNHFSCSDPTLPLDDSNGVHQACALFRKQTGYQKSITIHLQKKIPVEGGFGGGSGNIATTLWALNQLSGEQIPEGTLASWAAELSSDAPFFFSSGTAYATGRGEKIESLPSLKKEVFFLAKPERGLCTPLVYKQCCPNRSLEDPRQLLAEALAGSIQGVNDLEGAAFFLYPELKKIKTHLIDLGFTKVCMTGSGSGFYCLGEVENPALPGLQFWKTHSLSRGEGWYPCPSSANL